MVFSSFLAAAVSKKESRSPRGFLPRPLLRAGESIAPPPHPQKICGGARLHISAFSPCENTRVAREGFTLRNVLGISFEKSSRKCYNDTTKIKNNCFRRTGLFPYGNSIGFRYFRN